jgi:hypothetical protein
MNGKGDTYRPYNQAAYGEGYDRIFRGPKAGIPASELEHRLGGSPKETSDDQTPIEQADSQAVINRDAPLNVGPLGDFILARQAARRHDDEAAEPE